MKKVLITGVQGFIGRNLLTHLSTLPLYQIQGIDIDNTPADLEQGIREADFIFHLAGVNRPQHESEFETGNAELSVRITEMLRRFSKRTTLFFSSSIQAEIDNPYGRSKKKAEDALIAYGTETGAPVCIFRLPNVFGKWCRPNYNSAVATFCYNIIRDIPITLSDPNKELVLVYIEDVIREFLELLAGNSYETGKYFYSVSKVFRITLGDLAEKLREFKSFRVTNMIPDLNDDFSRALYTTYLSYLPEDGFSYPLDQKTDARGLLAEFLKSRDMGQIFLSKTIPGITRGNHYHHAKVEKFCVIQGKAVIRFRHIQNGRVLEYNVDGDHIDVVDIPPGYTHSLENVGRDVVLTLFWASELFDAGKPDTYPMDVLK